MKGSFGEVARGRTIAEFLPPFNPHLHHSNGRKSKPLLLLHEMKLPKITAKSFSPSRLFPSKKHRSNLSKSEPPSFGSASSSSPISVLPPHPHPHLSGEWSDFSDTHTDAKLYRKELEALLGLIGAEPPSEEELKMMMSQVEKVGPACDSELRDTFEIFDADHDGRITAEELFSVFSAMGDEQCTLEDCRRMIAGVDKNGDGFVCFEDFAVMMECQRC